MTWWIKIDKKHEIKSWISELRSCTYSIENDIRTEREHQEKWNEEIRQICIANMDNEERDLDKLMNPKHKEYLLLEPVARKIATSEEKVSIYTQEAKSLKYFISVLDTEKSSPPSDSDLERIINAYVKTAPYIFNDRAVSVLHDIHRKLSNMYGYNKKLHESKTSDWRPSSDIEATINRHTVEKIRAALKLKLSTIVLKQLREYESALDSEVEFDKKDKL